MRSDGEPVGRRYCELARAGGSYGGNRSRHCERCIVAAQSDGKIAGSFVSHVGYCDGEFRRRGVAVSLRAEVVCVCFVQHNGMLQRLECLYVACVVGCPRV